MRSIARSFLPLRGVIDFICKAASLFVRLALVLESLKLFRIPAAAHAYGARSAEAIEAVRSLGQCRQCLDPACSRKLLDLAQLESDLLPGQPLGDSLASVAWDMTCVNSDLERDHAQHRCIYMSKRAPFLTNFSIAASVLELKKEHKARGGTVPSGWSRSAVKAAGLAQKAQKTRRGIRSPSAFVMYFAKEMQMWKARNLRARARGAKQD